MARNTSATRSARALFGLGALSQGIEKGMDERQALALKIAEMAVKKQEKDQTDQEQAANLRLKLLQIKQGQQFPNPANPSQVITIPGVDQKTLEQQFPGILLPTPKAPLPAIPDLNVGFKGRPVSPPTDKSTAIAPGSQLETLNYLNGLLSKIPTSVGTGLTAGASKVLGGERSVAGVSVGSNPIKEYEDAKPGAAVQFYRALTGDTRLSDADARERALPFLPQVYPVPDTDTVRAGKMSRIQRAFQLAAQERTRNPDVPLDFTAVMSKASSDLKPGPSSPQAPVNNMIRVRRKDNGKTGSLPRSSFNPDIYEVIQ